MPAPPRDAEQRQAVQRLKFAVMVSLMLHALLLAVLYQQRLEYHADPVHQQGLVVEQPDSDPEPAEYALVHESESLGRGDIDRPLATDRPLPPPNELGRQIEWSKLGEPLRRRQDALARAALTLAKLNRRELAGAALPDAAALATAPPIDATEEAARAEQAVSGPAAVAAELRRAAAPRIAPDTLVSVSELPAARVTQDRPRQRAADPLPTIALDSSRARSRRRVEAAPLPEMPSETERFAEQTTTHATRATDALATRPERVPDSSLPDAAAAAGAADPATTRLARTATDGLARALTTVPAGPPLEAGLPDTQSSGRPAAQTLRRRRSAEADPGLQSGGGVDRPRRSRGPIPAAPVLAPMPAIATAPTPEGPTAKVAASMPPVAINAALGDGGLGRSPAEDAGLADRLPSRDSSLIHLTPAERSNRRVGGKPTDGGPARRPSAAYALRGRRQLTSPNANGGRASTQTDEAIELGLQYLARIQLDDGRWEFQYLGDDADRQESERVIIHADAAATGLALLAFLGAGYDHFGDRYEQNVQAGLDYLTRIQSPNGELFPEHDQPIGQVARFYGHGIATLALCEAYGMTGDPALRQPAQSAIDYLVATQHPQFGGWRYVPGTNTDLSVSGWQLLALKSGEMAGLTVRPETYERLRALVERCREPDGQRARFCYNPWASPTDPRTRHGRQASTVMTSVGTLMQLYLDAESSDERLRLGADHLLANLPQIGDSAAPAPTGTLGNPQRDTYYWYYGTQVMYRLGGEYWQAWNKRLHPLLVTSQTTSGPLAGSWDPQRPVPDKWADYGGRLYVTAMNVLSLEIYHRHLPLDGSTRFADRPEK